MNNQIQVDPEKYWKTEYKICPSCNKRFYRRRNEDFLEWEQHRFCSKKCAALNQWKHQFWWNAPNPHKRPSWNET